jgi:para-aminobenzoate synthetase component 1
VRDDPTAPITAIDGCDALAVVRSGDGWVVASEPVEVVEASGVDVFAVLDRLTPGFWAGYLGFELGHAVEPVRARPGRTPPQHPDAVLVRFAHRARVTAIDLGTHPDPPVLGAACRSSLERDEYLDAVDVVLAHIREGDCYQVNLTRTLEWDTAADPVGLFAALARHTPAPHGALLRLPTRHGPLAVVSASPERFLAWRGAQVETRPIKGTAADPRVLAASAKDHAENVMIVDLARNDLGRVCEFGTVHVPDLCTIECHPGLAHLVSTVQATRRTDTTLGDLVRATMPPASVTGAPKPRVLQIIEDLEPVRRGVYCGAIGWIDTARDAGDLAVAIRTFTIADERTTLGVGGGIVADSDPAREWDETCLKASRLLASAGALDAEPVGVPA